MPYKDKEKQREYLRKYVAKRRSDFFADKVCIKCGSKERLELDHINPEEKITHHIWTWKESRRLEEIAKCQVLCHDCHLKKTSEYRDSQIQHGTAKKRYKHNCDCEICKEGVRQRMRNWRAG